MRPGAVLGDGRVGSLEIWGKRRVKGDAISRFGLRDPDSKDLIGGLIDDAIIGFEQKCEVWMDCSSHHLWHWRCNDQTLYLPTGE